MLPGDFSVVLTLTSVEVTHRVTMSSNLLRGTDPLLIASVKAETPM